MLGRGDRKPYKNDVKRFVEQMPAIPHYWSTLEACFHQLLHEFSLEQSADDIRSVWLKFVRDALWTAWELNKNSVDAGDAWVIRALIKAERPVLAKLKELKDEIRNLKPQEEAV